MILSKPALLAGFNHQSGKHNVGVHEFAHLVEKEENEYGLPPEVPWMAVRQWVRYVARELDHPSRRGARVGAYAYTNEHEFFAVLAEYFFTSPESVEASRSRLVRNAAGHVSPGHGSLLPLVSGRRQGIGPQRALPLRQRQEIQTLLSVEGRRHRRQSSSLMAKREGASGRASPYNVLPEKGKGTGYLSHRRRVATAGCPLF